eukprot:TRINITY_DN24791_c0_g1_i1.p1 TRINITY_DN24791_c0_g1~~TRINITY_DN24791_c0_g1_i1.p1  ORF type:complete len:1080 (-),score=186.94 TRINITY_DN24791_c0_g1_i1:27-3209(-)
MMEPTDASDKDQRCAAEMKAAVVGALSSPVGNGQVSDDPHLNKELVKILTEVDGPEQDMSRSIEPVDLATPSTAEAGVGGLAPASLEPSTRETDSCTTAVAARWQDPPVRPESPKHGLEVGPETHQRWMLPVDMNSATHTRMTTKSHGLRLTGAIGPAASARRSAPDYLQSLWAANASEGATPSSSRRRDAGGEWRHGEIFFEETGHACRFMVAPPGDHEAVDVLRALLDPSFGLPRPDMVFSAASSQGNYWDMEEEIKELRGAGARWPQDPEEASDAYRRDMEGVLLGICCAAVECGAWLVGTGRRSGGDTSGALFESGVRQFNRVHPERDGGVTFLGLGGCCAPDVLEKAQVRLPGDLQPWSTLMNPLTGELIDLRRVAVVLGEEPTEQVRYPDVGHLWTQEVTTKQGSETLGCLCLNPTLTHMLLCTDMVRKKVQDLLEHVLPAVHVFASGEGRACLDRAVDRALRGSQVVVLQNAGIWANALAKSVFERKCQRDNASSVSIGASASRGFPLPEQVDASKFAVLDVLGDTEESVVEKLSNMLTIIAGEDARELGFNSTERQRLQYAWELYLLYTLNASRFLTWSRVAHYSFTFIALLTTVCAVLLTAASLPEETVDSLGEVSMLKFEQVRFGRTETIALALACSLLPLLSAFLLSVNSRFTPRTKYASFLAAAAKVRCAIYRYRSRVAEFRPPHRNALVRGLSSDMRRGGMLLTGKPRSSGRRSGHGSAAGRRAAGQPGGLDTLRETARSASTLPVTEAPTRETSATGWGIVTGASAFGRLPAHVPGSRLGSAHGGKRVPSSAPAALTLSSGGARGFARGGAERCKPSERFAEVLGSIHSELSAGVARMGSMAEPTTRDWRRLEESLGHYVDSPRRSWRGWCLSRIRRSEKVVEENMHDDAFCLVTADDYIRFRLEPLIAGLKVRAPFLARAYATMQTVSFLGTAIAGALGVLAMREFIPIVVAVVASVDSIAQFEQLQVRLLATNSALSELQGVLLWWNALSLAERRRPASKERLVSVTEEVAGSEAVVFGCTTRNQVPPRLYSETDESDSDWDRR